jgi:hypothetical protein
MVMSLATSKPPVVALPTHLDLPESDGSIVTNNREHPQGLLLTNSILPVLRRIHPENDFIVSQDMGIY